MYPVRVCALALAAAISACGVDDQRVFTAFMGSSSHRANVLGPYGFIGTAWAVAGRTGYIAVEFG